MGVPILRPVGGVKEKNNQVKGKMIGAMGKPTSTLPGGNDKDAIVREPPLKNCNI
ncbi:MAG: hypothetical protein ACYC4H_05400 [Desulfocucumaceae bacterium]